MSSPFGLSALMEAVNNVDRDLEMNDALFENMISLESDTFTVHDAAEMGLVSTGDETSADDFLDSDVENDPDVDRIESVLSSMVDSEDEDDVSELTEESFIEINDLLESVIENDSYDADYSIV